MGYLHLSSGYEASENTTVVPTEVDGKFLQWKKLSSKAAMYLLSVALTVGILSLAGQALGLQKVGSTGSEVRNTQSCLKRLGYFNGAVTGRFLSLTQNAVIRFQQANRLTPDGVVGGNTQRVLEQACYGRVPNRNNSGDLRVGSRGVAVSRLQRDLRQLRYFNGPNTGYYGSQTRQAVMQFERDNRLYADGIADAQVLSLLNRGQPVGYNYQPVRSFLSVGDQGENVTVVQKRLSDFGFFNRNPDGYFDEYTRTSVISFQRSYQLNTTGTVDSQTWQALGFNNSPVATSYNNAYSVPTVTSYNSDRPNEDRYVVVVPIYNNNTLSKVQQYIPNAFQAQSRLGRYVNAGSFRDRLTAERVSQRLRSNGIDARVKYF